MKKETRGLYDNLESTMVSGNGMYYDERYIYILNTVPKKRQLEFVNALYIADDDGHPTIVTRYPLYSSRGGGDWVDCYTGVEICLGSHDIESEQEEIERLSDAGYVTTVIAGLRLAIPKSELNEYISLEDAIELAIFQ